eukprot:403366297
MEQKNQNSNNILQNQQQKLEKEFYFTKLDLMNTNDFVYVFVEFEEHPTDLKQDFTVGTLTILKSNLQTTPIFSAQLQSMSCFNKEIEWNYAYFKKIRLSFYRRLKDVKFAFKDPHQSYKSDDIEYMLQDEKPKFRIYFKVQQQADVVAFECNTLKPQIQPQPMHYFADKLSEYFKRKNKELDEIKNERDKERKEKLQAMSELQKVIKIQEHRELNLMQKFCLIVNEKKAKISELKSIVKALQEEESLRSKQSGESQQSKDRP